MSEDSYAGDLAWSRQGELAVTQRGRIVLLSASGRVLETLPIPGGAPLVCGIAWSPNGKQLVAWAAKAFSDYPAEPTGLWIGNVKTKTWRQLPLAITWKNEYACSLSWR